MPERLEIPAQTLILTKPNPTKEEREQATKEKIIFYLTELEKLEFPKVQSNDKISNYIDVLLNLLRKEFGEQKSAYETLIGLERNYKKIQLNGKLLEDTIVQDFVDFYTFKELKENKKILEFRSILGFREVKAAIAVKLIEKIKQSIET